MKKLRLITSLILSTALLSACGNAQKDIQVPTESNVQTTDEQVEILNDAIDVDEETKILNAEKARIHFEPVNSPMPQAVTEKWVKIAAKYYDDHLVERDDILEDEGADDAQTAMFILAMMYRILDNHPDAFDLSPYRQTIIEKDYDFVEYHTVEREMFRWFIMLDGESSVLGDLFKSPTLVYQMPASLSCPDDHGKAAVEWLEQAAARGYEDAEYLLAIIYLNGVFGDENKEKGVNYMRRAAIHGLKVAQYDLAMMYELGIHLPNDLDTAAEWATIDHGEADYWLNKAAEITEDGNGQKHDSAILITTLKSIDKMDYEKFLEKYVNLISYESEFVKVIDELNEFVLNQLNQDNTTWYHVWYSLLQGGNFKETCKYEFDVGDIGTSFWSYLEDYDHCQSNYLDDSIEPFSKDGEEEEYESDEEGCGDEENYDGEDEEEEEESEEVKAAREMRWRIYRYGNNSLNYSIDYALDNEWLTRSAEDPSHFASRQLRALTLAGKGCRGTVKSGDPIDEAIRLIQADTTELNQPLRHLQLANLYYVDLEQYQKAFDLYKLATEEGNLFAKTHLYRILSKYDNKKILDKIYPEKQNTIRYNLYKEYYKNECGNSHAGNLALNIADQYKDISSLSPQKAEIVIKWYYRFLENYFYYYRYNDNIVYESQTGYKKAVFNIYYLLKNNEGKLPHIHANKALVDEWARRVVQFDIFDRSIYVNAKQRLAQLPVIDNFKDEIVNQIKLEQGKNIDDFYVIKSVKTPFIYGDLSRSELDDIYYESVQKAKTAIVATLLAKNEKITPEILKNTFFHLAVELPSDMAFYNLCEMSSPVCKDIRNSELGKDSYDTKYYLFQQSIHRRELFYIWYLRQFPYAAEEMYKKLGLKKKWKKYTDEARNFIDNNEFAREAMNYDPRLYLQALPEIDFSNVPDI